MPAMKEKFAGVDRYRHFINGQWTDSTAKEWIEVENPATGEIIATVPKGTADDADRALVAAAAAQPGCAAAAATRARSASSAVPLGTVAMISPVAGFSTSIHSLAVESVHWPLMKWR